MIEAYSRGDKWFDDQPTHPFTIAVHAIRNLKTYENWLDKDMPFASFDIGADRTFHAKIGSPDYEESIKGGLKPL